MDCTDSRVLFDNTKRETDRMKKIQSSQRQSIQTQSLQRKDEYAWKGSYTIEAAIILPVILLFLVHVAELAVEIYQAVQDTVSMCEQIKQEDPSEVVRMLLFGKEIVEEITCR